MKTKQRILSVLMILALVASLVAVFAAPAGANVSQPGTPTLAAHSGGATTAVTGVSTNYSAMDFYLGTALAQNDIINLTFPSGTVVSEANVTADYGGTDFDASLINQGETNVILITANVAIVAGTKITIVANQVTNPSPGSKTYSIFTSKETTPVASAAYSIRGIKITGGATATPTKAASGTTMTITGFGYTVGKSIDIRSGGTGSLYTDGTLIAHIDANDNTDGSFSTTFTNVAGTMRAIDGAGVGGAYNSVATTLAPSISLSKTSGLIGSTTIVTGTNFTNVATGNTTTITVGGASVLATALVAAEVVSATSFKRTITLPASTGGVKEVKATHGTESAVAVFTTTPQAVTLTPSTATPGSTVTISGTGYKASETVTITYGGSNVATKKCGTDGSFSTTFAVATGSATGNVVAANAVSGSTAFAKLTITAGSASLSPVTGPAGTSVTITGVGLAVSTVYTIRWTDPATGSADTIVLGNASSNSTGGLSAVVTIPASTIGAGSITLWTGSAAASATTTDTFTVTVGSVVVPVSDALANISGKYTKVWSFAAATQEWLLYDVDPAAPSTLTTMTTGQGYWLEVSEAVTLLYAGNSYSLSLGWNLIGWLG